LYDTFKQTIVVRHIHVTLDEERFQRAKEGKGADRTWPQAIMEEIAVGSDREDADGSV
jgi:hypothetical protein